MATSSNSFTVSLLVNGITYRITASNGSVDIGSDVSQVNYSSTFQFWQQEAGQSTKSFSCYYAVFTKKGSSYSLIASGGKATSYSLSSRTVYRDGANAIDAFVVCIYDSSHTTHSGYLIELEIPVNRQGNTGEPNISYELTPNVDKIHFKANGNAYSPSSQSLYCGYVKKVGTNNETHVGTNANQIDKSLNSNVFTVFYRFLKTDGTYTTPAKNSSLTNCTLSITSSTPYVSVEFILVDDTTYNANKVITNIAIPISKDGLQGKMGRNLYYAGDSAELAGTTFTVTDTSAPYVSVVSSNGTTCYAFKGENGTYTFPSSSAGYPGTDWEQMFNMKYFISEAIFSNFAKLGSAIFNEDYMFSYYGSSVSLDGVRDANNIRWYNYIDPSDIGARNIQRRLYYDTARTVSNTAYSSSYRYRLGGWDANTGKAIILNVSITGSAVLHIKIADADGSNAIVLDSTSLTERTKSESDSSWRISYLATGTEKYAHYYKSGSGTITINSLTVADCKFRPNIYADWLKGFFYSQYGYFKDVTIEGRINNLITVIDWEHNIGRDKIIEAWYKTDQMGDFDCKYSEQGSYTHKRYYIDVLACGNFIYIKSLPEASSSTNVHYRLPYYAFSNLFDRGHTTDMDGNTHIMTSDEMRQLIGRKITIKIDSIGYYNRIDGMMDLQPMNQDDAIWTANGKNYFRDDTYNNVSIALIPQVVHLECKAVVWTNSATQVTYDGFGYVWVGHQGIDSNSPHADSIDTNWT